MLLESVMIVYKKQNTDHFWPLYFLKNLGGQGFLPYTPFGTSLNFKVLFNKTFFSEFMEFQRIIWFILICLHFVMTQKSVHIKTKAQTYYIICCATLAVCSAVHSDTNCLFFVRLDFTFYIFQQDISHQISLWILYTLWSKYEIRTKIRTGQKFHEIHHCAVSKHPAICNLIFRSK